MKLKSLNFKYNKGYNRMYTRQIGILIDAVDGSEENYMLLVEALVAEVNHLQTYLISRGMTVADYQEYLDTLSRTTVH